MAWIADFKSHLLANLLVIILGMCTPTVMKLIADSILDVIEKIAEDSDNTLDDKAVLPLCRLARITFGIKDE